MKIGFIGTGNMGGAIMRGYGKEAVISGDELYAYNKTRSKLIEVCEASGAEPLGSIGEVMDTCDIIALCMEPKVIRDNIDEISSGYRPEKLIISIAAGIDIAFFEERLGPGAMVVRVMPNMPARIGMGMSSVSRNEKVTDRLFTKVLDIFCGIGLAEEIEEELIDAVIGVSGSSPAYTYMYIDALAKAAEKNGMDYSQAVRFAAQAVAGAASVVLGSDCTPEELIDMVCTEGGTTIEAYKALKRNGFADDIAEAFQATVDRSREMTKGR